jgi:hypothetical protein
VTTGDYRRALDSAMREYEELTAQRAALDDRIAQLSQTIGFLTRLCGLTPTVGLGLTDAVRMALRAAGHPLTATEVREQLAGMGVDLERYSNDLAAIHTILRRLTESGEALFKPRAWNKPAYAWKRVPLVVPVVPHTTKTTKTTKATEHTKTTKTTRQTNERKRGRA